MTIDGALYPMVTAYTARYGAPMFVLPALVRALHAEREELVQTAVAFVQQVRARAGNIEAAEFIPALDARRLDGPLDGERHRYTFGHLWSGEPWVKWVAESTFHDPTAPESEPVLTRLYGWRAIVAAATAQITSAPDQEEFRAWQVAEYLAGRPVLAE